MGILPVKYVIMSKRLKFLKYLLDENDDSMIRKVYETQKSESRKGDFVHQIKADMKEIGLEIKDTEIIKYNKTKWSKTVNEKIEKAALKELIIENETKTKTKYLQYKTLDMQGYLKVNKNS